MVYFLFLFPSSTYFDIFIITCPSQAQQLCISLNNNLWFTSRNYSYFNSRSLEYHRASSFFISSFFGFITSKFPFASLRFFFLILTICNVIVRICRWKTWNNESNDSSANYYFSIIFVHQWKKKFINHIFFLFSQFDDHSLWINFITPKSNIFLRFKLTFFLTILITKPNFSRWVQYLHQTLNMKKSITQTLSKWQKY